MANQTQRKITNGQKSSVLVLGLDLGTTSFKIAMIAAEELLDGLDPLLLTRNPSSCLMVLENFPGHREHSLSSVPTCLFYMPMAESPKWGHEAEEYQRKENFDSDFFVALWKVALHQSPDPTASRLRQRLQRTTQRLGKNGLDSFAEDFSKALDTFLFEDKEESPIIKYFGSAMFSHIDIVIAVPPGWPREDHETLSNAVARGLGETRNIRIFRSSETECVLRSWMQDPNVRAKSGEILLLVDLGGGTVCISVFRCEVAKDGTMTWTHMESHSLSAGSEMVSEEFERDFKQRLSGVLNVTVTSKLVYKARKKFDERKITIGEKLSETDLFIKVTGLERDVTKDFYEDKMYFSRERLLGYFQPSQSQILCKIRLLTDRITIEHGSPPKYCLNAGAYANNILYRRGLEEMNHHNMKIITLPNSADSVARGACLTRLDGNFHQFAGGTSKNSIAILTYICTTKAVIRYPQPAIHKFKNDKTEYTPALLWTIRKGDPIRPNHVVEEESGEDQRRRTFERGQEIYFTDTMFISDSDIPKEEVYTALRFNTTDLTLWKQNMSNLRTRGITGSLYDVTWDMKKVKLEQKDGSSGPMHYTDIDIDQTDPRSRGRRRVMCYKFFLDVSTTDIVISIKTFHTRNREGNLVVAQKKISMADNGEFESAALEEEYNNIGADGEMFEGLSEEFEYDHHSQSLPTKSNSTIHPHSSHGETQASTTLSKHALEAFSLMHTQVPLAYASPLQGASSTAGNMPRGDPKRVALTDYTGSLASTPIARQKDFGERGRAGTLQTSRPTTRASSGYRTRSSTPIGSSDRSYQPKKGCLLRESQSTPVSARDTRSSGRTVSSLRTPVVPAKKRGYDFDDDYEEDED